MSFPKNTDPAKRDLIVAEYLETKKNFQQNFLTERLGDSGLQSIIASYICKKLMMNEKIKTLADVKLNTICDYIEKALMDDNISDEEYSLMLSEIEKFNNKKEEIRSKIKVVMDVVNEVTKKSGRKTKNESIKKTKHT